jgi:hypothetical protein
MNGRLATVKATIVITRTTTSDIHPAPTDSRSALLGSSGR